MNARLTVWLSCPAAIFLALFASGLFAVEDQSGFEVGHARVMGETLFHEGEPLSAYGTAEIDGVAGPGEWANAASIAVFGDSIPGSTFYVMNDEDNLYLLLVAADRSLDDGDGPGVRFDNQNNGVHDEFEDSVNVSSTHGFRDAHFSLGYGWGILDRQQDGSGSASRTGLGSVFEMAHPLRSGDIHDFALSPGDVIGFCLSYYDGGTSTELMSFPTSCRHAQYEQQRYWDIIIAEPRVIYGTHVLRAPDDKGHDPRFAASDGDIVAIGAPSDDGCGDAAGASFVFVRTGADAWPDGTDVSPAGCTAGDSFGHAVAVSDETAVVGAPRDDDDGYASGSAYVFVRSGDGQWIEQAKLLPWDGATGSGFGQSVAVDGESAVIGAPWSGYGGSAGVFTRDTAGRWLQTYRLRPSDGARVDGFGRAVAIQGDTIIAGAPGDDVQAQDSGAVYVFEQARLGRWIEQAKLLASDWTERGAFGHAIALDGNTAVVGVPRDDADGIRSGAVYVFTRTEADLWSEHAKLVPSDGAPYDRFGESLALDRDLLLVGVPEDAEPGLGDGSVYVFTRDGAGVWTEQAKLLPSEGYSTDGFGRSVALAGETAVVTADYSYPTATAYVFDLDEFRDPASPAHLITTIRDANGNSSADFSVTSHTEEGLDLSCRDGANGESIAGNVLGYGKLRLTETLADVSGNGLDEVMALTIADDGRRIVRLFDSADGKLVSMLTFDPRFDYPLALLALDDSVDILGGRALAVIQPNDAGRALAIVRDALTGQSISALRYGLAIGTPIGGAVLADLNGNAVEEIAVFGQSALGQAKVQIRDALSGEKLATFGFDKRFTPLLVGGIPSINEGGSDELVVVGVNADGVVRIEVKDSLTQQRLTTRWLRRIEEETPLATGYVDHPAGPALAVLTEGVDGKYRTRIKRLTSSEPGWQVNFPSNITPHDFAVMDDTSGNGVPELLVVGENHRGLIKAMARDAETGEELFRTNVP